MNKQMLVCSILATAEDERDLMLLKKVCGQVYLFGEDWRDALDGQAVGGAGNQLGIISDDVGVVEALLGEMPLEALWHVLIDLQLRHEFVDLRLPLHPAIHDVKRPHLHAL